MSPEEIARVKDLLPTSLGSDELRESVAADILRRSVFSARMTNAYYLAKLRDVCALVSAGKINYAEARERLLAVLAEIGHTPQDGGGLKNPASIRRLNLILDTQRQMAGSVSRLMAETDATRDLFPAWELTRLESRAIPRADWPARWRAASSAVGDKGVAKSTNRFIALKSSPIWQALGDGAGGFTDTLRNPYPPFAYASGMGWLAVPREECESLGLVATSGPRPTAGGASPTREDGSAMPSLSPAAADIADAVRRYGFPEIAEGLS